MKYLTGMDYLVIGIYFGILLFIGWYLKSRASKNIEHYFLGGKKLPWWALGVSGMAAWLGDNYPRRTNRIGYLSV